MNLQILYDRLQAAWHEAFAPIPSQHESWVIVWKASENHCQYLIGPFPSHDDAYEHLCTMPAIGSLEGGHKYIEAVLRPPL